MRIMRNEEDTGKETEESNNDTCSIDSITKVLVRNNDADADSEDNNYDALNSEGSTPKLLIRKEHVDETHLEKEQKWDNLSDANDKTYELQDTKINKDKIKPLGSEILLSAKRRNEE